MAAAAFANWGRLGWPLLGYRKLLPVKYRVEHSSALPSNGLQVYGVRWEPQAPTFANFCRRAASPFLISIPPLPSGADPAISGPGGRLPLGLGFCAFTVRTCTKFGLLTLRIITKIVAIRCQILRLKCTKFDFGWAPPDSAMGVYSPLQTP